MKRSKIESVTIIFFSSKYQPFTWDVIFAYMCTVAPGQILFVFLHCLQIINNPKDRKSPAKIYFY